MDLAIVVHGAAVKNLLSDDAYEARYGHKNPNLELLIKLHEAGVRIFVCGQSMAFGGIAKSELAEPVKVALSAMTMLTVLQSEGYALLP
jgi:intracellular sulfur oxidation DsrE/DsrF family protein